MKHYSIKHGVCVIDISTFTYRNAFNWSIYTRVLDELYENKDNISTVTFKNFDKLFKIVRINIIGQSPNKYYSLTRKRNLVGKIIDFTCSIFDIDTSDSFNLDKVLDYDIKIKTVS